MKTKRLWGSVWSMLLVASLTLSSCTKEVFTIDPYHYEYVIHNYNDAKCIVAINLIDVNTGAEVIGTIVSSEGTVKANETVNFVGDNGEIIKARSTITFSGEGDSSLRGRTIILTITADGYYPQIIEVEIPDTDKGHTVYVPVNLHMQPVTGGYIELIPDSMKQKEFNLIHEEYTDTSTTHRILTFTPGADNLLSVPTENGTKLDSIVVVEDCLDTINVVRGDMNVTGSIIACQDAQAPDSVLEMAKEKFREYILSMSEYQDGNIIVDTYLDNDVDKVTAELQTRYRHQVSYLETEVVTSDGQVWRFRIPNVYMTDVISNEVSIRVETERPQHNGGNIGK